MGGAHLSSSPNLTMDMDMDPLDSHTPNGLAPTRMKKFDSIFKWKRFKWILQLYLEIFMEIMLYFFFFFFSDADTLAHPTGDIITHSSRWQLDREDDSGCCESGKEMQRKEW